MIFLKINSTMRISWFVFSLCLISGSGQSSSVTDIAPAVASVPATSVAGAPLQQAETLQLTDQVIERLFTDNRTSEFAEYSTFDDEHSAEHSATAARFQRTSGPACRTFPGDPDWPKALVWKTLDALLGGALIPTVPIASSCYDTEWGTKDITECANVINNFTNPLFHHADPTSNMWPIFQGRTCMPTNDSSTKTCTLGGYPEYAVKVTNVAQIQLWASQAALVLSASGCTT
jgi:hypothetical protein